MANTAEQPAIQLIVGLGNPGARYEHTRHNAGFWYVAQLVRAYHACLQPEKKFFGLTARITLAEQPVHMVCPTTFMNCSGQAVGAISRFFAIPPPAILVVHDDLALPVGVGRLKQGGGHGGHNGLRDIIASLGQCRDFRRLRLGIAHPGDSRQVLDYVLGKPSCADRQRIDGVITEAVRLTPRLVTGSWQPVVQQLHTFTSK